MMNINVNDKIEKQPVVVRQISKKTSQTNKEYYDLQVSYGIKNYNAKIWNNNPDISNEITPGCIAFIWGIARDFKGIIQIHINNIEKIENPNEEILSQVMPCCQQNEAKLQKKVKEIISSIKNEYLNSLLNEVFEIPYIKENFFKKAAGAEIHHAYVGGLAQHTIEVTEIVIQLCNIYPYINYDIAVTSALLHDIGKTIELSKFPENKYTDKGRLLGHIALGIEILNKAVSKIEGFPQDLKLELEHCILSHHGMLEMGSPVVPMTLEAIALHNADKASADINGFYLAIQRDTGKDNWTDYNSTYRRFIKKSKDNI